jgi:phosphate transport system substrate-binding protein
VDIGDSDIYADPALYPDPNLTDHLVCVIPFTMIANTDVTGVKSLTRQQIIDIYSTNKIRNWKDVGGPDLPIVPVVRLSSSGTRATFRKYILGGRDENGTVLQTESSQAVLQAVSSTPGAIGYLAASALDNSVQQIGIDGQNATPAAIEAGKYAFWGFEHMYTIGESDGPVSQFLDFMLTSDIQKLAASLGYIPIADMQVATPASGSAPATAASTRAFARPEGENFHA